MYEPNIDGGTVHAVRLAFQRSRSGSRAWAGHQPAGRLDSRACWRNTALRDRDIFRDKVAPTVTKVNAYILVDGSGSMSWPVDRDPSLPMHQWKDPNATGRPRIEAATDVVATLVEAFRHISSVRLNVWLHNTAIHTRDADINMVEVIRNGKGREHLRRLPDLVENGNGDGYAIKWLAAKMQRDTRPDEVALLIVVSDGLPSVLVRGARNLDQEALVFNAANEARDHGVNVLSVAIAKVPAQTTMYGRENVIPFWTPEDPEAWGVLAAEFGATLGRTLSAAAKAKARGRRR